MSLSPALPGSVPDACVVRARVVLNRPMAKNTWKLRLHAPNVAARSIPGQFYMVRLPGRDDPLLGRPFALYDVWTEADASGAAGGPPAGIDIGYVVVGKVTSLLADLHEGDEVELWGPLGNGFPVLAQKRVVCVAGGIGQTPFLAYGRELLGTQSYGSPVRQQPVVANREVLLCYGARSRELLAGVNDFEQAGVEVQVSTDDGSAGHAGRVTDLLRQVLGMTTVDTAVVTCGPEPMMHAVARVCDEYQVPCWLSLETPMACGFGACFSCVTRVMQPDGSWDYARVCVEGPVFPAGVLAGWRA